MVTFPNWQTRVQETLEIDPQPKEALLSFREKVLHTIPENIKNGEVKVVLSGKDTLHNQALHNLFERSSQNPSQGFESMDVKVTKIQEEGGQQSFAVRYANRSSLLGLHQTCIDRMQTSVMTKALHSMSTNKR